MQNNKAIILLGIKHSGKSTQGKLLAKELNCPCLDVDDAIAKLFKKTAREIYTEKGPMGFMYAEEVACQKIAETYKNRQIIISTGGSSGRGQRQRDRARFALFRTPTPIFESEII